MINDAVKYSNNSVNRIRHAEYFLKKFGGLLKFKEKEDILDVGCGDGRLTSTILHPFIGPKFLNCMIGADYSQEVVDVGNEKYKKSNLSFVRMNIADPNVGQEYTKYFGKIFSFYYFQFIKPSDAWAANIHKMLKNQGQVFAILQLTPNCYTQVLDQQKREKTSPWINYVRQASDLYVDFGENPTQTVEQILTKAGLKVQKISVEVIKFDYPSVEMYQAINIALNHIVSSIPDDMKDNYMRDFMKKSRGQVHKDQEGQIHFQMNVLFFLATK